MNEKQVELIVGSLLHDYGKLLYRYNDGRSHSQSGYEHLKTLGVFEKNKNILNCVRYHHAKKMPVSRLENDDICFITYIADNIASAERRKKDDAESGFSRQLQFESVFNILNGNNQNYVYKIYEENETERQGQLKEKPLYPTNPENAPTLNDSFYARIIDDIDDALRVLELSEDFVNSLLSVLKFNLSFIPSSTQKNERVDISLYDHSKLTAAFASAIEQYLDEQNITDYKTELFSHAKNFYNKKAFLIFSLDFSGIQKFIYDISSKTALKGLRARSFYLEILMQFFVDELLSRLNLSRANIIYTGGGHTYLVLPNTKTAKQVAMQTVDELNQWLIDNFDNSLYAVPAYSECSSNDLKNEPDGSYRKIFENINKMTNDCKVHKYTSEQIRRLNKPKKNDHSRECVICHRMGNLNEENQCDICSSLIRLSDMILDKESLFVIVNESYPKTKIKLPFGYYLTAENPQNLLEIINEDCYIRSYSKNKAYTGKSVSTSLFVGNYAGGKTFEELVNNSNGIKRLGVIRADVDNLAQKFESGFSETGGGNYETISRTSVFSRRVAEFFNYHINYLLSNGEYQLLENHSKERNATVVYSGGDDLFIVGSWDDIICFAVDLYNSIKKYTQNTLTLSAGIGIYHSKYPIYSFASETEELEEYSKKSKNTITLFDKENSYSWDKFINNVLGEKLTALKQFIDNNSSHGKALLYNMLNLIHGKEKNGLNIARFAYLLSRIEPKTSNNEQKEKYKSFKEVMYSWINDKDDCHQLMTAIYIYLYMTREGE
ncbi:MAG: type III-A CRISPR-associated protein Cas10/Csm1 [Acutalibacteraceae bacterium]